MKHSYLKKWKIWMAIMLFSWMQGASTAGAEEIYSYALGSGSKVYQFEELLGYYQMNSPVYQKCSVAYQIEALNATLATESYHAANREYIDITVRLSELNSARDALLAYEAEAADAGALEEIHTQLDAVEAQISQYNKSAGSVRLSLAQTKLQEGIAEFYDTSKYLLISNAEAALKNDFLKKCYGLILTQEQQDYYLAYQAYLQTFRKVQAIKCQRGLVSQAALEEADTNLMKNEVALFKNQAAYNITLASIQKETNLGEDTTFFFKLTAEKKEYKLEEQQEIFLSNNVTLRQLRNYINSYTNYQNTDAAKSQALIKQIDLKIKDYELQEGELRAKIRTYVKDAITSYENAFRTFEMAKSDRKLKIKQLEIVTAKKAHKRATELEVCQAAYEKEAAEVSYYKSYYDIILWQNILDNRIYGAAP